MEKITITCLHGTYYTLYDCYGEIETSRNYNKIKELYEDIKNDKFLQEDVYINGDMGLRIEKNVYDENGRFIDSEVVAE